MRTSAVPDASVAYGIKDDVFFLWDAANNPVISAINVDKDGRIFLNTPGMTPELRDSSARVVRQMNGNPRRIRLLDFVYHVLGDNPVVPHFTVVPYNQLREDVRLKNLYYVRGEPKNFKFTTHFPVNPAVNIGLAVLPRGVTTYIPNKNRPDRLEFHVLPDSSFLRLDGSGPPAARGKKRKIAFIVDNAEEVYERSVVPLLHAADPEFVVKNDTYQAYAAEFYAAKEAAGL